MHLSDHDLNSLTRPPWNLTPEQARALLSQAIEDLKRARERLAQNPTNSSRPPSTRAPWEQAETQGQETDAAVGPRQSGEEGTSESASRETKPQSAPDGTEREQRSPRPAQGCTRAQPTQQLSVDAEAVHAPPCCPSAGISWMIPTSSGRITPATCWFWCPPLEGEVAWWCSKPSMSTWRDAAPAGTGPSAPASDTPTSLQSPPADFVFVCALTNIVCRAPIIYTLACPSTLSTSHTPARPPSSPLPRRLCTHPNTNSAFHPRHLSSSPNGTAPNLHSSSTACITPAPSPSNTLSFDAEAAPSPVLDVIATYDRSPPGGCANAISKACSAPPRNVRRTTGYPD